ncbi:hypothetical protein J8A68_000004 (mitochondrion) [[Candida] subhashii]|uniref:Uncharacterized protein n=1 Tax=[Candida] subhashii TaxID=561895 RepID=A0A8J5V3J5_9ASCO|nr:hypothetical protein J8A68_000004 [[Candida] subhashii]
MVSSALWSPQPIPPQQQPSVQRHGHSPRHRDDLLVHHAYPHRCTRELLPAGAHRCGRHGVRKTEQRQLLNATTSTGVCHRITPDRERCRNRMNGPTRSHQLHRDHTEHENDRNGANGQPAVRVSDLLHRHPAAAVTASPNGSGDTASDGP